MAKSKRKKLKQGGTPVIRKDLDGDVIAEANNDGSIYVDKSVKKGSPLEKEAIAHEKVHIEQMKRGDLDYDDNNVYWKGKIYPRSSMNEGAGTLPWEREAYNKTKNMKSNKKNSVLKMGFDSLSQSSPITYKSSALKYKTDVFIPDVLTSEDFEEADGLDYEVPTKAEMAEGLGRSSSYKDPFSGDAYTLGGNAFNAGLKYATQSIESNSTKEPIQGDIDKPKSKYNQGAAERQNVKRSNTILRRAQNQEIRRATRDYYKMKEERDGEKVSRFNRKTIDPTKGKPFTEKGYFEFRNKGKASTENIIGKRYNSPATYKMNGFGSKSKK